MWRHLSYIALVGIAGCATAGFAPDPASPAPAGKPVVVDVADGRVELSSAGVIELVPSAGLAASAVHVRIALEPGDTAPWTFDAGAQRLSVAGAPSRALFVNADTDQLPIATIGGSERRVFDLYFDVPIVDADEVREVSLTWQVSTPDGTLERTQTFSRHDLVAQGEARAFWWYGAHHPWPVYALGPTGASRDLVRLPSAAPSPRDTSCRRDRGTCSAGR